METNSGEVVQNNLQENLNINKAKLKAYVLANACAKSL